MKYKEEKAAIEAEQKVIDEEIAQAKTKHVMTPSKHNGNPTPGEPSTNKLQPAFHDLTEMELTSRCRRRWVWGRGIWSRSGERRQPEQDDDIRNRGQGCCDQRTVTGIRLDVLTDKRLPANGPLSAERELCEVVRG